MPRVFQVWVPDSSSQITYFRLSRFTPQTLNCATPIQRWWRNAYLWGLIVHPCEKVIGMFFQNQIWSRLLDINQLCSVCIKRSIEEVEKCQISKRGYQQGRMMKHWIKLNVNFVMISSVIELWRRWLSLTIKCAILPKLLLAWQTGEARVLFHDFLCYFA